MTLRPGSRSLKVPFVALIACGLLLGLVVPDRTVSAQADDPDVEDDAEAWCDELDSQGYDTTDCVDTYMSAYAGDLDLGPNSPPYFDEADADIELTCTESVEYQEYLDDPSLPNPCPDVGDPYPCGPGPAPGDPLPNPCPVPVPPPVLNPPQLKRQTWKLPFTTKLFIAEFPPSKCGTPAFVKIGTPQQVATKLAKYATFCAALANGFKQNPQNGTAVPLDAQLWSRADLEIVCEENKQLPVGGSIGVGGVASGMDVGGLQADVAASERDTIVANGSFGFVTSGSPHLVLEPTYIAAGGPRNRRAIWSHVTATVKCRTEKAKNGAIVLNATISPRVAGTNFPSTRIWWNGKLHFDRKQESMSVLWDLPQVPAP